MCVCVCRIDQMPRWLPGALIALFIVQFHFRGGTFLSRTNMKGYSLMKLAVIESKSQQPNRWSMIFLLLLLFVSNHGDEDRTSHSFPLSFSQFLPFFPRLTCLDCSAGSTFDRICSLIVTRARASHTSETAPIRFTRHATYLRTQYQREW